MSDADGQVPEEESKEAPVVRKRLSRGERYDLILEHAIDVFGTRGYHNVAMDDIADAAGVSKALVYQHFESKDELYLEVLRSFQSQIKESVLPAWAADLPPQERFWRGFVAFFDFVDKNRQAWGVLYRDAVEIDDAMIKGIHSMNTELAEAVADAFIQVLKERDSNPLLTAYSLAAGHAVVGAVHSLADFWLDHPDETNFRLAGTAMAVLWNGFGQLIDTGEPWFPTEEMLKGLI
ncbi:MAG: TetR/AcrR family transcriptional regulator [Thermoleophilaceae bacterium]|nr:TetR/AcrR family transcriptional regulator [Thermoleophilaceae bacterium]